MKFVVASGKYTMRIIGANKKDISVPMQNTSTDLETIFCLYDPLYLHLFNLVFDCYEMME